MSVGKRGAQRGPEWPTIAQGHAEDDPGLSLQSCALSAFSLVKVQCCYKLFYPWRASTLQPSF